MQTMLDKGYRVTGPVSVNTGAGNAQAIPLYQVSNSPLQVGTKSFKIKKIHIEDEGTGGTAIHIGIGVAGAVVDVMPTFQTITNMDNHWEEEDISQYEFFGDAMWYPDAGAAGLLHAQVEVEEIG